MSADKEYSALLQRVLTTGTKRTGRNGETISRFGERIEFADVGNEFPILTTKRVYWKGVVEELLWFLSGSSDVSVLREQGVHIWDGNSTRAYLDSIGLTAYSEHEEGGPIYGWQWRHFGAKYINCKTDYSGQGTDQIVGLIDGIRRDPASRRHMLCAWNAADIGAMILPPCHVLYQFYVENGHLDCQMYMRSCDVFLGLPFNIASTATLMYLIAGACNLVPRKLIIVFGDCHIYSTHLDAVNEQMKREGRAGTVLKIREGSISRDLHGMKAEDFILEGYNPHKTIKADMIA